MSSLPGSPKFVARKGSLPVRLMRQVNAGRHLGDKGAENQNVDGERAMPFCAACTQIAASECSFKVSILNKSFRWVAEIFFEIVE